jgi:hypothetical protein
MLSSFFSQKKGSGKSLNTTHTTDNQGRLDYGKKKTVRRGDSFFRKVRLHDARGLWEGCDGTIKDDQEALDPRQESAPRTDEEVKDKLFFFRARFLFPPALCEAKGLKERCVSFKRA